MNDVLNAELPPGPRYVRRLTTEELSTFVVEVFIARSRSVVRLERARADRQFAAFLASVAEPADRSR